MKITELNVNDQDMKEIGIQQFHMRKMGQVVLIAGRNGAGKTRLLRWLPQLTGTRMHSEYEDAPRQIARLQEGIKFYSDAIKGRPEDPMVKDWQNTIVQNKAQLAYQESLIEKFKLIRLEGPGSIVPFVPITVELQEGGNLSLAASKQSHQHISQPGFGAMQQNSMAALIGHLERYVRASHPETDFEGAPGIIEDWKSLQNLLTILLQTKITWGNKDMEPEIFGRPLNQAELSSGQKVLLQFALALHHQKIQLDQTVLLLDEPENHLHPAALIDIVQRLKEAVPNGQIWIATHSVPLISNLYDGENLWYMDQGKLDYSGNMPERVLAGLLGKEEQIEKLKDFCNLPAHLAANRFAYESLFSPQAIPSTENDPQLQQIRNLIQDRLQGAKSLRILDYGAGEGRLFEALLEWVPEEFAKIQYYAYEPFPPSSRLESLLESQYGNSTHLVTKPADFEIDANSVDLVLMTNVLHEINPRDWVSTFALDQPIGKYLSGSGYLCIVEDQLLPKGEKAHANGFILLDRIHLKELFQIPESEKEFTTTASPRNSRLKLHCLPKHCLQPITPGSRTAALQGVINQAQDEIKTLRTSESDYKNGKLHAFWAHQFTNASLAHSEG